MKDTLFLNHNENTHQVEDELKSRFLYSLLEQMFEEVPDVLSEINAIWQDTFPLIPEQKVKIRHFINTYGLQVIDDGAGEMKVFLEGQLIGEWFQSKYKLKRDMSKLDRKKQFYLEMEINCWSIFENNTEQTRE